MPGANARARAGRRLREASQPTLPAVHPGIMGLRAVSGGTAAPRGLEQRRIQNTDRAFVRAFPRRRDRTDTQAALVVDLTDGPEVLRLLLPELRGQSDPKA